MRYTFSDNEFYAGIEFLALLAYPDKRDWVINGRAVHYCEALADYIRLAHIDRHGLGAVRARKQDRAIVRPNRQHLFKTLKAGGARVIRRLIVAEAVKAADMRGSFRIGTKKVWVVESLSSVFGSSMKGGKLGSVRLGATTRLRNSNGRTDDIDPGTALLRTFRADLKESIPVLHMALAMLTTGNVPLWLEEAGYSRNTEITLFEWQSFYIHKADIWIDRALEKAVAFRESAGRVIPNEYIAKGRPEKSTTYHDAIVPRTPAQNAILAQMPAMWYPSEEAYLATLPREFHPTYKREKITVITDEEWRSWCESQTDLKPYKGVLGRYKSEQMVELRWKNLPH